MSNKFRIKVEQIIGVNDNGYEKTECVLDARVEDLNMIDLVQTLYKIDRDNRLAMPDRRKNMNRQTDDREAAEIESEVSQSELIAALATKHPYYCSESNYYSNDPSCTWDTATDFLNEYEDGDVNMNLVFRWDIQQKTDNNDNPVPGVYSASIFMMHQRKGIFAPHYIRVVLPAEAQRLKDYLEKHWKTIQAIWSPFSG